MKENPIIITGINGFVGNSLSTYFKLNGKSIIGVSRNPCNTDISYKDLNKKLLTNSKSIIHLAGIAHDLKNNLNDQDYFEVNTELTKNIFDTFLESNC